MPAPKVVVVKPPKAAPTPTGKLNDTMGMVRGAIRKTVAPAVSAANEPRPPGRITKEPERRRGRLRPGGDDFNRTKPVPVVSTGTKLRPGGDDFNRTKPVPVVSTGTKLRPGGDDFNRTKPVPAKPKKSPVPHASPTARRHANRHARFNRTITDPTLKAWAEGAKAAALEARTKYETANPRPARKSTT